MFIITFTCKDLLRDEYFDEDVLCFFEPKEDDLFYITTFSRYATTPKFLHLEDIMSSSHRLDCVLITRIAVDYPQGHYKNVWDRDRFSAFLEHCREDEQAQLTEARDHVDYVMYHSKSRLVEVHIA